jgi:carotenoid cleavage dioxygenase-like enzyme
MSMTDVLEKAAAEATSSNPYLRGNFAPVNVETTAFDLPTKGAIPKELEGRFLRIGPNPVTVDPANYHWFIGTGMAHGLRLNGGKAEWYRNRYIIGQGAANALGRDNIPGPMNGFGDNANTNIVEMGGKTYAIVEAGSLPVELSYELESVQRSNFGSTLPHGFSAHPKYDPVTGGMHVMTYQPGLQAISYLFVDKDGQCAKAVDIPAPHCPMIHDIAFTARYAIILDLPVDFEMSLIGKGFPFAWNDKRAGQIGLLPRNGDLAAMRWVEAPECYVFHVMNAYDDGAEVVIDVARHPKMFASEMRGPSEGKPYLCRWRISADGRLTETTMDERGLEFPRFNDAHAGQAYRYGYSASAGDALQEFGPSFKHDLVKGVNQTHDYGPGRQGLEPVFVARGGATAEDDGWIINYVYDANRNTSDVVILDAQDFEGAPVATIELPVRVPFGFHGNWVADAA